MRFAALGFALGVCLLQKQPELPGAAWLAMYFTLAAIAAIGFSRRVSPVIGAGATFVGFAALGFAWAAAFALLRLSDRLDRALEGRDVLVIGVVAGLPQTFERGVRFDFDVESPETGVPRRIVLSSYGGFAPDDSQGVLPVRAEGAGASRCGCAARTAAPTRTGSITRPGCSSAAFARPAM
jgi:competence protein ComEC